MREHSLVVAAGDTRRMECLRFAKGDLRQAQELYAWVMGWAPTQLATTAIDVQIDMHRSRAPEPADSPVDPEHCERCGRLGAGCSCSEEGE